MQTPAAAAASTSAPAHRWPPLGARLQHRTAAAHALYDVRRLNLIVTWTSCVCSIGATTQVQGRRWPRTRHLGNAEVRQLQSRPQGARCARSLACVVPVRCRLMHVQSHHARFLQLLLASPSQGAVMPLPASGCRRCDVCESGMVTHASHLHCNCMPCCAIANVTHSVTSELRPKVLSAGNVAQMRSSITPSALTLRCQRSWCRRKKPMTLCWCA